MAYEHLLPPTAERIAAESSVSAPAAPNAAKAVLFLFFNAFPRSHSTGLTAKTFMQAYTIPAQEERAPHKKSVRSGREKQPRNAINARTAAIRNGVNAVPNDDNPEIPLRVQSRAIATNATAKKGWLFG